MSDLPFQIITILADLVIISFVGYYFLKLRTKEKALEKKEDKVDIDYHHVVDDALARERKILEDATVEADQIIAGAQYVTSDSKKSIDQALAQMVVDIHHEATNTARQFTTNYQESLKQIADSSLKNFQESTNKFKEDIENQVKTFHETMLPTMQKELEEYKKARMQQSEQIATRIIQKVSQEVLNKSFSLEEHKDLVIQSLEKAKKEGAFD